MSKYKKIAVVFTLVLVSVFLSHVAVQAEEQPAPTLPSNPVPIQIIPQPTLPSNPVPTNPTMPLPNPPAPIGMNPPESSESFYTCNENNQCVEDSEYGEYDNNTCDNECDDSTEKFYSCNENEQCVEDPDGEYSDGTCDEVCAPLNSFPTQPTYTPPIQSTNLGQLIQQIFSWSLLVLGVAVFVSFFYAGFLYLTAAGNTTRTGEAKSRMTNAIFGAILLLSSYLILYTINPDFVKNTFNLPGLGTTSPGGGNPPPGGPPPVGQDCTTSPNWQACNEAGQLGLVDRVKAYVVSQNIADVTTPCGGFEIVKRVAWALQATGAGTLTTFHSSRCPATEMSGDIVAYPDGSMVDILSSGRTQWLPMPGPITESGVSYAAPTDPGDPTGSY